MAQLEHIEAIEKRLWSAADTLRANSNFAANEFFMPVMGLIFLRHAYSRYLAVKDEVVKSLPSRGGKTREPTKEDFSAKGAVSHESEARADMMFDATRNWEKPMTLERLYSWHAALFPTGYSGLVKIAVGRMRNDNEGLMRVVSRHGMMERVHFVAPEAARLEVEVGKFLDYANNVENDTPWLVRAAIGHLWFLTLHPFDDGNGRLARTLTEYLLARGERSAMRFYSLSTQIQQEKESYYEELEHAQRGSMDVTRWVKWFLGCHLRAVKSAGTQLAAILAKADFWREHAADDLNANQRTMLNKLFDGFEGNLTSSKWAKICKVSQDTASREINVLVTGGILRQQGQGRSTHYVLACHSAP